MISYWWVRPHTVTALLCLPMLVLATLVPEEWYLRAGSPKFLDLEGLTLGLFGVFAFIGAAWLADRPYGRTHGTRTAPLRVPERLYRLVMHVIVWATLLGYVIWLWRYIVHPSLILPILEGVPGAVYEAKLIAQRIPGLTSLTNLGPLYVVLFCLHARLTGAKLRKSDWVLFAVFVFFSVCRVFIYSERRAVLEFAIPLMLIYLGGARRPSWVGRFVPALVIVPFVLFFSLSEYFRSWLNFYVGRWDSFWDFVIFRLLSYYTTALNNGAGVIHYVDTLFTPVYTARWFWRFPIEIVPGGPAAYFGVDTSIHRQFLFELANPEFNNTSGLYAVFIDFGLVLGVVTWAVLGWLSGRMHRGFVEETTYGLLLYPIWFVGILEIPRVFYFGSSPFFPALVATLFVGWIFNRAREPSPDQSPYGRPAEVGGPG